MKAALAGVGISFWLAMAGGVSAGPPAPERVIGGNVADDAEWPYAVALTTADGSQFCGGTVISADAVVTAAHCLVDRRRRPVSPAQVRVVTGRPDLRDESSGQTLRVERFFVTRQYRRSYHKDIAVIRLSRPTVASPALLPRPSEDREATGVGDELRVAGYGATNRDGVGGGSPVLRAVETFSVRDRKCSRSYRFFRPGEEICTLGRRSGAGRTSSCFGDSGGPLISDSPRGALLVGAVSYGAQGQPCGVGPPTVYTRVANNLAFVKKKAGLSR